MKKLYCLIFISFMIFVAAYAENPFQKPGSVQPKTSKVSAFPDDFVANPNEIVWWGTGELVAGSIIFDGKVRTFHVYIPKVYTQRFTTTRRGVPLVLALHGHGSADGLTMRGFALEPIADNEGFIIVYPDGLLPPAKGEPGYNPNWARGWNAGHCCGFANITKVDDVGFLEMLIRYLQQEYNLDDGRTFVMGASNGGMMAYRFASERAEMVAAIAPLLGTLGGLDDGTREYWQAMMPTSHVPLIAFNCIKDEVIPFDGSSEYLSAQASTDFWAQSNGWQGTDWRDVRYEDMKYFPDREYTIINYPCYFGDTVFYMIWNEGHTWPYLRRTTVSLKTDEVAAIIWKFFRYHPTVPPSAPANFTAARIVSKAFVLREYNNLISWERTPDATEADFNLKEYQLLVKVNDTPGWTLLETVPASEMKEGVVHKFWHLKTSNHTKYTYLVQVITVDGVTGLPAYADVNPE